MSTPIKPSNGTASSYSLSSSQEVAKKEQASESSEKSSFAVIGKHQWRSFVAGEVQNEIPSEDLGPMVDTLNSLGELEDTGLPEGHLGPIAEEAHQEEALAAEEAGPAMIHKSQYGAAIDGIMGTLMLGELDVSRPSAHDLQMPTVPALEDVMRQSGGSPENFDSLISRYDVSRKATLALLDNTKMTLSSGAVNYFEAGALQEYIHLLEGNLLHIERQIDKARFMQDTKNVVEKANKARTERLLDEEENGPPRPF